MDAKPVDRAQVLASSMWPHGDGQTAVLLTHTAHPGWEFVLWFTAAGEIGACDVRSVSAPFDPGRYGPFMSKEQDAEMLRPRLRDGANVTRRFLCKVPLRDLELSARAHLELRSRAGKPEPADVEAAPELRTLVERFDALVAGSPVRPGRRGTPDRYYVDLARAYLEVVQSGSLRPNADLADQLHLNVQTVTGQIYEARRRGLLSGTERGKSGGDLTPKAQAILAAEEGN